MKTIYLIPHSHYDVVWAFNKEDYLNINETILTYAMKMIKESGFKFLIEQTFPLEQLEKRKPEFFAEIRDAIYSGKIEIVDGCYIMPDLMIPSGETLLREFLSGNRYCKKKFGIDIPVAYAADTFGLNAQMPQIYKKCGFKWLVFRRGLPKLIGRKVSEFLWEGIDGSQIVAHWLPMGYRAGLELDKWEESVQKLSRLATTDVIFMPCGSGGTPPQMEVPENVEEWNKHHTDSQMVIATPRQFFEAFEKQKIKNGYLPVFKGELYSADLQDVFPDVVSSRMRLKLAIKESESMLLLAEKLATLAMLEDGQSYPAETMAKMWEEMLFLANHDVLPSCGIDEIYEEAWQYVDDIRLKSRALIAKSANAIVKEREDGDEVCVAVFNPYTWPVTDWVEADLEQGNEWRDEPGIMLNGQEIASEILELKRRKDGSISKAKIGFMATERPMNHQVFQVCKKSKTFESQIEVDGNEVLTKHFKLKISETSGILQVFNNDGVKILEGNEIIIDQELGDLYFHRHQLDEYIGSESGKGIRFGTFKPEGITINRGPLKTTVTYKSVFYCLRWPYYLTEKFGNLLHRQKTLDLVKKVTVYEDLARIDFETYLNLHQTHVRIRLKFDTCMTIPEIWRQTQFGALKIPESKIFEQGANVPAPDWVTAQEGGRGIAFMTLGVPVNEIRAGEIYYTLLRSVSVLSADGISGPLIPTPGALEIGEHTYKYSIYPYQGDWRDAGIYKSALKFEQSLLPVQINSSVNKNYESFSLKPDNLIISALKKAEDDDAIILRFFEAKGEKCRAVLKFPTQIKKVMLVNLLEIEENEIRIDDSTLELEVGAFEIVSLKLFIK